MPRVVVYVSGFGYGHATRVVAWCRALLLSRPDVEIVVVADRASDVLRASLPMCRVEKRGTDGSIVLEEGRLDVDVSGSRAALRAEVAQWPAWVERERALVASADLVVSDIVAPAFLVAESVGVPAVGVSNFTWHELHAGWHPDAPEVDALAQAYGACTGFLELPFSTGIPAVTSPTPVPLLVRAPTRTRTVMRRHLRLDGLTAFRSAGVVTGPAPHAGTHTTVVPFRPDAPAGAVVVPPEEVETQDVVAACDYVVTKPGYGVLSEAVQARIPVFVAPRDGHAEDQALARGIEGLRAGRRIAIDDLLSGWEPSEDEVRGILVPAVPCNGAEVIAERLGRYL